MFPLWTGAVNQNGEPCELLWLRIEICFHLWCCLRCWKMMCDEGRIKYIVSFFYSLWVKNDFLPFWGTLIRSFEAVPTGLWLDESPPYRPLGNTWTFSLGCPTLHHSCSLPSVWSLCRNARNGRHRVPQEAGHHLPLVLTCWLVFSCSQPHPGYCVEDVETWAGPAQSFIHRVCSWWRALTSEITATFGKGKKMKGEKQKGKERSSPWPAGKRTYKRSSEEKPPLSILSGDICHLSADKFPMVII